MKYLMFFLALLTLFLLLGASGCDGDELFDAFEKCRATAEEGAGDGK